jgi:hypothetical protein
MVVNGDGQLLLGAILSNDVAIQKLFDLRRTGKSLGWCGGLVALFVFQNGLAHTNAFVADVRAGVVGRRTDQLFDLLLSLMAKGTAQRLFWIEFFHWREGLVSGELRRSPLTTF